MGPPPVAVIVSQYNGEVTGRLLAGAKAEYLRRGGSEWSLGVFEVPGAFELTTMAGVLTRLKGWHAVICLGCLIKGETKHDEYIASAVTNTLAGLTARTGIAIGYGLITANTPEQALARAGGDKGNKGTDAMAAALETMKAMAVVRQGAEARNAGAQSRVGGPSPDKTRPGGGV